MTPDTDIPDALPHIPEGPIPPGRPLLWAESTDEHANSHFEALSHVYCDQNGTPNEYFRIGPVIRGNEVAWLVKSTCDELQQPIATGGEGTYLFPSPAEAKAACERVEIELGGAQSAPRPLQPNPDDSAPLATDADGYAPTRKIAARWSRNGGVLYLARVWAKTDNIEITKLVDLHGEEYAAALPQYLRQQIVQALVARIVDGWKVPLRIEGPAIGRMVLECEMHFVQAISLKWETPAEYNHRLDAEEDRPAVTIDLPPPSHEVIASIVGQQLAAQMEQTDKELAGRTVEDLQREVARNARKLGIDSPMPEAGDLGGNVLPITLEHLQAEGIDLNGRGLK